MRWILPLTIILAGCGGGIDTTPTDPEGDADTDADADADADADTDTDTDTDGCLEMTDGNWGFNGDNFGGQASAQLIWDGSCTFTLQTWAPQGDLPNGGSVVGDQVTLDGPQPVWATCMGTLDVDNQRVEQGTCTLNNSSWGMQLM